jgi:glutaredoxin 3
MNKNQPAVKEVRVYTKPDCQYCDYARDLLKQRGVSFREVDIGEDYVLRGWLAWATGQRTLPQIFIDGEPIGGFADLMTMDATGELRRRIQKSA